MACEGRRNDSRGNLGGGSGATSCLPLTLAIVGLQLPVWTRSGTMAEGQLGAVVGARKPFLRPVALKRARFDPDQDPEPQKQQSTSQKKKYCQIH
jgi:hypothetical protein